MRADIPTRSLGCVIEGETGKGRTEVRGKTGNVCAKDRGGEQRGVGVRVVVIEGQSFTLHSDIDLNSPLTSYHQHTDQQL